MGHCQNLILHSESSFASTFYSNLVAHNPTGHRAPSQKLRLISELIGKIHCLYVNCKKKNQEWLNCSIFLKQNIPRFLSNYGIFLFFGPSKRYNLATTGYENARLPKDQHPILAAACVNQGFRCLGVVRSALIWSCYSKMM